MNFLHVQMLGKKLEGFPRWHHALQGGLKLAQASEFRSSCGSIKKLGSKQTKWRAMSHKGTLVRIRKTVIFNKHYFCTWEKSMQASPLLLYKPIWALQMNQQSCGQGRSDLQVGQATWISKMVLQHPSWKDFKETKLPQHKRKVRA